MINKRPGNKSGQHAGLVLRRTSSNPAEVYNVSLKLFLKRPRLAHLKRDCNFFYLKKTCNGVLLHFLSQLHSFTKCFDFSVTRFCEILQLWQNFKSLWANFWKAYLAIG